MLPIPQIPGVKHSFIEINKTKLHVAQAGKGKPLLLLHGWPQHWYVWRKIIPELSKNYHLIMPDLPGFGWSDIPKTNDFQKETLAQNMISLLDKLKLQKIGLIGHDWGGWIGFLMCLNKPELFDNYIALGITYPFKQSYSYLQNWRFLYQLPISTPFLGEKLLQTFPLLTEWGIKQCAYKKAALSKEDLRIYSAILKAPERAKASSLLYRTFLMKELSQLKHYRNQKLTITTRLLLGEKDPIISPALFPDKKPVEALTIRVIKDCGHFLSEERPEKVIKMVKEMF